MLTLSIALSVLSLALCAVVLYSNSHTHSFEENWTYDSMYHWHDPTCEHQIEGSRAEHLYTKSETKCDVCGYVQPTQGLMYRSNNGSDAISSIAFPITSYSVVGRGNATTMDINVPSTYRGKPVTCIEQNAFANDEVNSVVLPDSITTIERSAFHGCSNLSKIDISSSVTFIGEYAFYGCTNLSQIDIPSSVSSIGNSAFYGCSSLVKITIPNSVTSMGTNAFSNCNALIPYCQAESAPKSWASTWNGYNNWPVVWDCDNTDKDEYGYAYTVYNGLSYSVKDNMAQLRVQPSNLVSANIAHQVIYKDVKYIVGTFYPEIFSGCTNLAGIAIDEGHPDYTSLDNCLLTKDGKRIVLGCSNSIIPDSVIEIGDSAFYNCSALNEIVIPNSVTKIGRNAFGTCVNLQRLTLSDNLTEIGNSAFSNCSSLSAISLPNSLTSIGNGAFNCCSNLRSISIPDSVTTMDKAAFQACTNLTRVTIGKGLTSIEDYAFNRCKFLTDITIPGNITTIGELAFSECESLANVTLNDGLQIINSLAFKSCIHLTSINIPDTVTNISNQAFSTCEGLKSVHIGRSVKSISSNAFYMSYNITSLTVDVNNSIYKSIDNCLMEGGKRLLIGSDSGYIPDGTRVIGRHAFYYKSGFETIIIPSTVAVIESWAFSNCSNLKSVTIGANVINIELAAFRGCANLQEIRFDGTVAQWYEISKGVEWNSGIAATKVICTDGEVNLYKDSVY